MKHLNGPEIGVAEIWQA